VDQVHTALIKLGHLLDAWEGHDSNIPWLRSRTNRRNLAEGNTNAADLHRQLTARGCEAKHPRVQRFFAKTERAGLCPTTTYLEKTRARA
jgi:hypothetical protein